jgi:enterochelin esterase-like enzyme
MRGGMTGDRLAVATIRTAGEDIAVGVQPFVSDAERAAAGRETVAERFRALLADNRRRAAEQYAAGGVPQGEEVARVWLPRDPAALRRRLGGQALAAWSDDGILHVLWAGDAELAMLSGGLQAPLWPVDDAGLAAAGSPGGAGRLWEASLRIRRVDEAVITLVVTAIGRDDPAIGGRVRSQLTWRGPVAPPPAEQVPLRGEIHEHALESAALGARRGVTVYVPPRDAGGGAGLLPGCILADGQSCTPFASVLEAAILAGTTPPTVLVGVHNAVYFHPGKSSPPREDPRGLEYLPIHRSRRFGGHLAFVTDEVIPWAASRFPVRPGPWTAVGYSNGAVWAIAAGQRRPDIFTGVAAFSAGVPPRQVARASWGVRHYLAAGTLEPGFRQATSGWAARLERAGMAHAYREWPGGHDSYWWHRELPAALAWLLNEAGDPRRPGEGRTRAA